MKRSFDSKTAAILFVSLIVISGGLFGLHSLQAGRNAELFLDAARKEVEEEKNSEAVKSYRSYLRLKPGDATAQAELGKLLFDTGNLPAASSVLEQALLLNSDDVESRRMAAQAGLVMGRFNDVKQHLRRILGVGTDRELIDADQDGELVLVFKEGDGEVFDWLAQAEQGLKELRRAVLFYRRAIELSPDRVQTYFRLAYLYQRELEQPKEADAVLQDLVKKNPSSPDAHLIVARYRLMLTADAVTRGSADTVTQQTELAAAAAEKALAAAETAAPEGGEKISAKIDANKVDALAILAECKLRLGDLDAARQYAEAGLKQAPKVPQWYTLLANVESQSGNAEESLRWIRDGIKVVDNGVEDLLGNLANMLLDRIPASRSNRDELLKETKAIVERLRQLGTVRPLVSYLQGRLYFVEQQWLKASQTLEKARPEFDDNPSIKKQIDYWLGQCYGQLDKHDLQLNAFRRAVNIDPFWIRARMGVVSALSSMEQVDAAAEELEELMRLPGAPVQGWLDMARLSIMKNYRAGPTDADWTVTARLLDEAARLMPDSPDVVIQRAELLVAQGKADDAVLLLQSHRDKSPDELAYWMAQMQLYSRQRKMDRYEAVWQEANEKFGDVPVLRLIRARNLLQKSGADAPDEVLKELRRLAQPDKKFTQNELVYLWYGLAQFAMPLEAYDFAEEMLAKVSENDPNNLNLWLLRFDVALRKNDASQMPDLLSQIRKIEDEGALWHYGTAIYLRLKAKDDDKAQLQQALLHLNQAKTFRPRWDRLSLLTADIRQTLGETDAAIAGYVEAIDFGLRDANIIRLTMQLLFQKGDFAEANKLIQILDEQKMLFSSDTSIARMASQISGRLNDNERALDIARRAAAASNAYDDHLWLGQMAMTLGPFNQTNGGIAPEERIKLEEEAQQAFRNAVEIDSAKPGAWVSLVALLSRTGRMDEAKQIVEEAKSKIDAKDAPLAMARCSTYLGELDAAQKQYEELLKASPDDPQMVRTLAEFHLENLRNALASTTLDKQARAEASDRENKALERMLRQLMNLKDTGETDLAWARLQLAVLSLSRGNINGLNDALALTEANLEATPDDLATLRIRALLLSAQNAPKRRQEAVKIYRKIVAMSGERTAPEDLFALVNVYQQNGDFYEARNTLRTLVARTANSKLESQTNYPVYLSKYVTVLMHLEELSEAEVWLGVFEGLEENANPKVKNLLRAELESRRGHHGVAVKTLLDFKMPELPSDSIGPVIAAEVPKTNANPTEISSQLEYLASLQKPKTADKKSNEAGVSPQATAAETARVEEVKKIYLDAAEKVLRESVGDDPRQRLQLAAFLVRHQHQDDALDLIEEIARVLNTSDDLPIMSEAMFMVLESETPNAAQVARISNILDQLRSQHADSTILMMVRARVLDLQGNDAGSQQIYREIIKAQPENVVAMNNLALMLLADDSSLYEAAELSERTIAAAGRVPTLLDTRAMIAIAAGEYPKALQLLNDAIDQSADTNFLFHRAVVYQRLGDERRAIEDFSMVAPQQIRENRLIPLEKNWKRKLENLSLQ